MTPFELVAVLMCFVAVTGWINAMTVKIPHGVAMMLTGLAASLVLFLFQWLAPDSSLIHSITHVVGGIDFVSAVIGYMLAFLLFAGSMQVDLSEMRRRWISVGVLATLGVLATTSIVGVGVWLIAGWLGLNLPLVWALVFGALICPTDPVAVLAAVRRVKLPKALQVTLQGEALFNDGVGIVAFTALVALATGTGDVNPAGAVFQVAVEALGGLALGMAASAAVIFAMGTLDDFVVEVSMSIALAMSVYAGAQELHLSGAIAVVGAGMLFGGKRAQLAMTGVTERYLKSFWELADEILNALLFLMLGVELITVPFYLHQVGLLFAVIPLVLLARFLVVLPWGTYNHLRHAQRGWTIIMAWGGLHGALSLALALSLPGGPMRTLILSITYAMVAFSIAVQGLTFTRLVRWLRLKDE